MWTRLAEIQPLSHTAVRRRTFRRLTVAGFLVIGAASGWLRDIWLPLDGLLYDFSVAMFADDAGTDPSPGSPRGPVAVIVIDKRSLDSPELQGLPRALFQPVFGKLINTMSDAGVRAIGFDVLIGYSANLLVPNHDRPLLEALYRHRDKVVLGRSADDQPASPFLAALGFDQGSLGMLELTPDTDGVHRWVASKVGVGGEALPGLAAATLAKAGVEMPENVLLSPRSHPEAVDSFALVDVLRCVESDPEAVGTAFEGRVVLIGTTLPEEDRRIAPSRFMEPLSVPVAEPAAGCPPRPMASSAPGSGTIPGVYLHAMAVEATLTGQLLVKVQASVTALIGAAAGIIGALLGLFVAPVLAILCGLMLSIVLLCAEIGFAGHGVWIPLAGPTIALVIATIGGYPVRFLLETRHRRMIQTAFGQYLSPVVVDRISSDPESLKLGGETVELTILFCDVRGFTSISEAYKNNPEQLVQLVNRVMTALTEPILANGGTVDKYIGDCVMAFWNAPLSDPDHARHACRAALEMASAIERLNEEIDAEERAVDTPTLGVGIGINTGTVVVGNMGSRHRFDYTALGDAVNLAARLEGQCKTYGLSIILSDATQKLVPEFASLEIDRVLVKGRNEPVTVFAMMGDEKFAADPEFLAIDNRHSEFLDRYRGRDWRTAGRIAEEGRQLTPALSRLYSVFDSRIARFELSEPSSDWNAVHDASDY